MTNVSIGGNVTDSVLVYGNDNFVVKIGDVNGGVVNIIKPSDKPKYSVRPAPVVIKPRTFNSLLDREFEFVAIKKAVQLASPVSIWGQEGIGKTSFIRHITHSLEAGDFTSGTIYLNAADLGYEDLLQALFDSFFESDATYKPGTTEIIRSLQDIKALIFLDDLQIGREDATLILNAAPNSLFIFSSTERSLWGEGEIIPLRGLPENESVKLFEKEFSHPLNDQEKPVAAQICSALQGHPLQILQAASIARDSGRSVESLLSELAKDKEENKSMSYMSMAALSDSEKQVLALLAAAGGNVVSLDHIKSIIKGDTRQNDIQRLIKIGLVQSHSPRYSIAASLVTAISSSWDLTSWQDVLLNYAINWLSQQPASALVEESSGLLIHTIKNAGERQKWREVIQLGRALEKFMIYYKRWQTWSDILNLILTAAKALNDGKVQAWALHQLGSRALYLGYSSEAKTFLTQALNIRQAIGDKAGLAITQHNLNTLSGIVAPIKGQTSGCRRYLTCGCGGAVGLAILAALIWFGFNLLTPGIPNVETATVIPTAVTATPSFTATPTVTRTPTKTAIATRTPTLTPTSTPTPILLYDFVQHADKATWYQEDNGERVIDFLPTTPTPNPELIILNSDNGYAGWDFNVPMAGERNQKQVILAYPSFWKMIGAYELPFFDSPSPDAYLEVKVGYKDVPAKQPVGVVFRIYFNEDLVFEEKSLPRENPTINNPKIPVAVFEGINVARLEVEPLSELRFNQDYTVWAVVRLWNAKP